MSMGGEIHVGFKDQSWKFFLFENDKIDATKKNDLYDDILQIGRK